MDVRITVETTTKYGKTRTHELRGLSLADQNSNSEDLGLKLEDAKSLLRQLQQVILSDQIDAISHEGRICPDCNRARLIHDYRHRGLDTLFGQFRVRVPRSCRCLCSVGKSGSLSPSAQVFPDRATPELQRLQAELGARHSFREAARIMETFLPCAKQTNTTVRNRLGRIAEDINSKDPPDNAGSSSQPLTVFMVTSVKVV